jgi:hypothetical protein
LRIGFSLSRHKNHYSFCFNAQVKKKSKNKEKEDHCRCLVFTHATDLLLAALKGKTAHCEEQRWLTVRDGVFKRDLGMSSKERDKGESWRSGTSITPSSTVNCSLHLLCFSCRRFQCSFFLETNNGCLHQLRTSSLLPPFSYKTITTSRPPKKMEDRNAVASSVFFTGVSLTIEPDKLRQHFESVGHVVRFDTYGPAPGKDFRYGIAGYMDPQTAEEAIRRLNGTTFGERAMRVTAARSTTLHAPIRAGPGGGGSGPVGRPPFRKREREGFVPEASPSHQRPYGNSPYPRAHLPLYGRGRGRGAGGAGGPFGRVPMMPRPPVLPQQQSPSAAAAKDGPELMQLPHDFIDPVLGRGDTVVLNSLRGMATEEAYAAVEQLRVLALERPDEAKMLLQNCPALKSAVVITLQHAGKLARGRLPHEAYATARPAQRDSGKRAEEAPRAETASTAGSDKNNHNSGSTAAGSEGNPSPSTTAASASAPPNAEPPAKVIPAAAPPAAPPATSPVTPPVAPTSSPPAAPMTEQERDEVLELIQSMSEEDVDRVLTMSARDLAMVPDVAQRTQLQILQRRLLEMSRDL